MVIYWQTTDTDDFNHFVAADWDTYLAGEPNAFIVAATALWVTGNDYGPALWVTGADVSDVWTQGNQDGNVDVLGPDYQDFYSEGSVLQAIG
jgi:hypothetical protein